MKPNHAYFFLLPAILFLAVFYFIPSIEVFYFSLLNYNVFGANRFAGLNNYSRLLSDSNFWYALLNSSLFVLVTPILMFISLFLALVVRENSGRNKTFRAVFFLPVITPVVIVGIIWRYIFSEDVGLMNYLISTFSFSTVPWLTEYPTNLVSIMIVTIWRGFGYYMMIFLAGLAVIPKDLEEASIIDGANRIQRLFYVLLPMLKPTIILIFVLSATAAIKIFTELYIMIPGTLDSNKTLVYFMYKQAFENFDFGYGSAAGIIIFLLTIGFSYINIKLIEEK